MNALRPTELAVLSLARDSRDAARVLSQECDREDFASPDTQAAFDALCAMLALETEWPGYPGMLRHMRQRMPEQQANLIVADIATGLGVTANLRGYCHELRRERQMRDVRRLALGMRDESERGISAEQIAARAEKAAREILHRGARSEPVWIGEETPRTLAGGASMPTGFPTLDRHVHIRAGHFVTIGARTGIGKTSLMLSIARSASSAGWQVLMFSLEMPRAELRERMEKSGGMDMLLWVQESIRQHDTDAMIAAIADRFVHRFADRPTALLVDYLQIIKPSQRYYNRRDQVGHVVRELKALAMTLEIPVIVAAQLSRTAEDPDRIPRLSDLKETGEIEEVSDAVILIHRKRGHSATEILVDKNRHGIDHLRIPATFAGDQYRFTEDAFEDTAPAW